jgi:hypothetical protein
MHGTFLPGVLGTIDFVGNLGTFAKGRCLFEDHSPPSHPAALGGYVRCYLKPNVTPAVKR